MTTYPKVYRIKDINKVYNRGKNNHVYNYIFMDNLAIT